MSRTNDDKPALGSHVDLDKEDVHWDLGESLSYGEYLKLDDVLGAQHPLSGHHEEMLFIVIHQASELWMKLCIHELTSAMDHIRRDILGPAFKMLAPWSWGRSRGIAVSSSPPRPRSTPCPASYACGTRCPGRVSDACVRPWM